MKKLLALVGCVLMAASLLTACGEEENPANKVTAKIISINLTEEEYAYGVDKNQPELLKAVNELIAEIKGNGTYEEICNHYFGDGTPKKIESAELDETKDQLVVATETGFEPFEYMDGNYFVGIDMEIAELVAKKVGKELVILNMDFDAICLSVDQGKCDIAMAGLSVNEDRAKLVNFSDTYYEASQNLIVRSDDAKFDNCKTLEDVEKVLAELGEGTKVGYQAGTTAEYYVAGDEEWDFAGFANLVGSGYPNCALAVTDMLNGGISYVICDSAPAKFIVEAINALQ